MLFFCNKIYLAKKITNHLQVKTIPEKNGVGKEVTGWKTT